MLVKLETIGGNNIDPLMTLGSHVATFVFYDIYSNKGILGK